MHMVSPASEGLQRRKRSSYNSGPSQPTSWSMPSCSTGVGTGTMSSTTVRPLPWEGAGLWSDPHPSGMGTHISGLPPHGGSIPPAAQLLSATADAAKRRHFGAFGKGVALACKSPNPTAPNPISAADSSWKQVAYDKATLSAATAAWEGHRPGASKAPPPGWNREHPPSLTTYLVVQRGRKMVTKAGGTVGGTAGPTPHPPMLAPTAQRHQSPHR